VEASGENIPNDREENLERLLELGRALTSDVGLSGILDSILVAARGFTGAKHAGIRIPDDESHPSEFVTSGTPPGDHDPAAPDTGFVRAPIRIEDRPRGSIFIVGKEGGGMFDDDDVWILHLLAEWVAIAIHDDRLLQDVEGKRADLERAALGAEASSEIAFAVGSGTELGKILDLIAQRALELVSAAAVLILLREGSELRIAAHAGDADPEAGSSIPIDGSIPGLALMVRETQHIKDVPSALQTAASQLGIPHAQTALIVPMVFRGTSLGVLTAVDHTGADVDFYDADELALRTFAASAATAVYTARTVEKHRLRDSLSAAEDERKRWARDLHDGPLQGLGAIKLALSGIIWVDPQARRAAIDGARELLDLEIAGLREIIADLRPAALDELGLEPAVRTLAARVGRQGGLDVTLNFDLGDERLPAETENVAYRIMQEALTNVVRHSNAGAVLITADFDGNRLWLRVADDGEELDQDGDGGLGLKGMKERAALAGGEVTAEHTDEGFLVTLELPVAGQASWP